MSNNGDYRPPESSPRETWLPIMLTFMLGVGFFLFLNFASGGFFGYVVLIAGGLGLMGCIHYLLWGKSFGDQAKRGHVDEDEDDEPDWRSLPPPGERRF